MWTGRGNAAWYLLSLAVLILSFYRTAEAKSHEAPPSNAQAVQAQQAAQRQAQAMEAARQAQAARAHEQVMQQQQAFRTSQEQALKAQEAQARKAQEQAAKMQQEEAQAQRKGQEQAAKAQQQQAERAQEEAQAQRNAQQQAAKTQQQEAEKAQEAYAQRRLQEATANLDHHQGIIIPGQEQSHAQTRSFAEPEPAQQKAVAELRRPGSAAGYAGTARVPFAGVRAAQPRPLPPESVVPVKKAISMPVLEEGAAAADREHSQSVMQNLEAHLVPVPMSQAPAGWPAIKNNWLSSYENNYWAQVNDHRLLLNRQNTYINSVLPADYPYWYSPEPGWMFSNGFVLGNSIRCGLDWLRWGWHPYYGPAPDGFVCASDCIPTPWIYFPAYGLWMQPGVYGWAPNGPPYDYTGPISVEVLEPRRVHVNDPYTGWERANVINVVYLYNAFYDPEFERWGYVNRHGYYIWLNL